MCEFKFILSDELKTSLLVESTPANIQYIPLLNITNSYNVTFSNCKFNQDCYVPGMVGIICIENSGVIFGKNQVLVNSTNNTVDFDSQYNFIPQYDIDTCGTVIIHSIPIHVQSNSYIHLENVYTYNCGCLSSQPCTLLSLGSMCHISYLNTNMYVRTNPYCKIDQFYYPTTTQISSEELL